MTLPAGYAFDPELDLILEREVDIAPHLVWGAWTDPKHLVHWFCPKPWQTTHAEIDLRPGGKFRTVMRGPEGQEFDNTGCYLEVVDEHRLVWTSSLTPGFRPNPVSFPLQFTAVITIEPKGSGSVYKATVVHGTPDAAKQHGEMGFNSGWGIALEQLVAYMKSAG